MKHGRTILQICSRYTPVRVVSLWLLFSAHLSRFPCLLYGKRLMMMLLLYISCSLNLVFNQEVIYSHISLVVFLIEIKFCVPLFENSLVCNHWFSSIKSFGSCFSSWYQRQVAKSCSDYRFKILGFHKIWGFWFSKVPGAN